MYYTVCYICTVYNTVLYCIIVLLKKGPVLVQGPFWYRARFGPPTSTVLVSCRRRGIWYWLLYTLVSPCRRGAADTNYSMLLCLLPAKGSWYHLQYNTLSPAGGGTAGTGYSTRRYNDLSLPGNGARGPGGWRRRGGGTAAAKFESTDSIVKYSRVYQLEIINENKYAASFQCSINLVRSVRWTVKLKFYTEIL